MVKKLMLGYLVRIKTKDSNNWTYASTNFLMTRSDMEERDIELYSFMMDKETAEELVFGLITERKELEIEQVAIVEAMRNKPYCEVNVIFYREFSI